ncbi:MAG: hypothetical protein ABJC26_00365 [Gemmatimonadaceae bacterium]
MQYFASVSTPEKFLRDVHVDEDDVLAKVQLDVPALLLIPSKHNRPKYVNFRTSVNVVAT